MKCPKCQAENPETRKFCRECGAKLVLVCPQCHFENLPTDRFCGECGTVLEKAKAAPPIDYSKPKSYTPKFLADKILTTRSSIEGERKLVTVLFADVANFTPITEKLDPEEIHQIMDGCFRVLMDEIHKYEGTINQFTGDGVMALFGAPVAHEDHAQRACYAALAIQNSLADYGEKLKKERGIDFKMRIGLNSGPVVVGSIGDDLRMDYTAIGDTTNLASRMQSTAKPGAILSSGHTYKLVRDYFKFESLGKIQIKGKEESQEAYELIRTSEVKTRIEAAAVSGLTKFVGRRREMEALHEALEKVRSGSGQVVGIVGEAGVGKSRLILEMRKQFPKDEFSYLEGRCLHYGSSMAYLPLLDILRSYFGIKEGEQESLIKKKMNEKISELDQKLKIVLPPFQELLSLKVEDEAYLKLEPKQRKEQTFEVLRDLVIRLSQQRPLILVVEDLHWIDKTSEELLDYLIGSLAHARVLLVLLHRPEYTHQWGSNSYFNRVVLNQLTLKSSAEMMKVILGDGEADTELSDLILQRASGNPFFMEELIHTLLENGSILKKNNKYVLVRNPVELQVPDTIQGIIAARIDRLKEDLKGIMQVASVIGREFAFGILQAISGMGEELAAHLQNLKRLEFIYEKSLFPELEYIFKHALVQEVAYNGLLIRRRKEIHQKIGRVIEGLYTERLEEFYETLAHHYARSDEQEKAYRYLKLSGDKAYSRHANWEAFRYYRQAIEISDRMPQTESIKNEEIEARFRLYRPAMFLGYPEETLQPLQEGADLSRKLGEPRRAAEFESKLAAAYAFRGQSALAARHGERCFEEAEQVADLDLMAETARDLCFAYSLSGAYRKVLALTSRIIPLLEMENKHEVYGRTGSTHARLCIYAGMALGYLGRFEEGIASCEKARLAALRRTDSRTFFIGFFEMTSGMIFNTKGDGKAAVEHLQRALQIFEHTNALTIFGPLTSAHLGYGHTLLGDPETGREYAERGIKLQNDASIATFLSFVHFVLGDCSVTLDDPEKSLLHGEESLRLARLHGAKDFEGLALMLLGRVRALLGSPEFHHSENLLQQAIRVFADEGLRPYTAQANFYAGQAFALHGQSEKAREHLRIADEMFQEMSMSYWLTQSQKALKGL
jgi:class 3 adenylate cyclase/tetratricopeptide (TPR) repeat protein